MDCHDAPGEECDDEPAGLVHCHFQPEVIDDPGHPVDHPPPDHPVYQPPPDPPDIPAEISAPPDDEVQPAAPIPTEPVLADRPRRTRKPPEHLKDYELY